MFSLDEDEDRLQQEKFWAGTGSHSGSGQKLGLTQAVKTPSLEMFATQLDIQPSAAWSKLGAGPDFELSLLSAGHWDK